MASKDVRRLNPGIQVSNLNVGVASKINPHLAAETSMVSPSAPGSFMTPRTITGIDFNGSDEYLTLATNSDFDFNYDDPFSLSAWVNWTSTQELCVIGKMLPGAPWAYTGWSMDVYGRTILFQLINTWTSHTLRVRSHPGVIDASSWHNIVATYDGSTNASGVALYIDGADLGALTVDYDGLDAGESTTNSTAITIGQRLSWGYFDGNISNVSVWNKELSAAEVVDVWNYGRVPNLLEHSAVSSLVAWWQCGTGDNGSGTDDSTDSSDAASRIYDMSANSHHMTPVNMDDDEIQSVVG
jgi:hypothetical protein